MQLIKILFGTVTGNAEECAFRMAVALQKEEFPVEVVNLSVYPVKQITEEGLVIIVTSTWGDGEPPDDALPFFEHVQSLSPEALRNLSYAVYALGDRDYSQFCGFGCTLDELFAARGAQRMVERQECDLDYDTPLKPWVDTLIGTLSVSADLRQ
jgi:sulfite reductase alpha subunit-like flavoprotein